MVKTCIRCKIEKDIKQTLWESSLSRIRQHMSEHDSGFISASRGKIITPEGEEIILTHKQNVFRTNQLRDILTKKYDITLVRGAYIENYGTENEQEVGENSIFVVDSKDTGKLEEDLRALGEKFDQDSVLFVPKGGEKSILWGTNKNHPENFPGYNDTHVTKNAVFGQSGEFMTKVKGRPFIFKEGKVHEFRCDYSRGFFGEWGRHLHTLKDWKEVK